MTRDGDYSLEFLQDGESLVNSYRGYDSVYHLSDRRIVQCSTDNSGYPEQSIPLENVLSVERYEHNPILIMGLVMILGLVAGFSLRSDPALAVILLLATGGLTWLYTRERHTGIEIRSVNPDIAIRIRPHDKHDIECFVKDLRRRILTGE